MTTTPAPERAETEAMIAEVLSQYPKKAAKFRAKHLKANDPEGSKECEVKSNIKSRPGVMTIRGCAYAGSKGVVWGPVKDMVTISHGPVGCGQYSWATRRNYAHGHLGVDNFTAMQITTDFQEKDIVFGGDPKLEQGLDEIVELFPLAKGISVQSECPIGLIGDDIEAVARVSSRLDIPVMRVRCEGFRGVSQSLGHHIANDAVRDHVLGTGGDSFEQTDYDVALIGDYNIGGDAWASRRILEEMGLRVIAQWSGDGTINEMASTHLSKLNLIHCYRSMNYICTTMEERFGTPWTEFNFFGPTKIISSMRKIAEFFDDEIKAKNRAAIAGYQRCVDEITKAFRPRLEGKRVMLAVGPAPRHTIGSYEDLGMEVVGTAAEFAHRDDYTGPTACSKEGTGLYDDPSRVFELEEVAKRPDLIGSGPKEKYIFQKMGTPIEPYHGVDGFAIFARDMARHQQPGLDLLEAPWSKAGEVA
uniref:Nitrogenase molybdenum-iron protein alpha chain n=1 Tax=Frankia alni TaxID=1859 RepID=NIFD_FRAAL|nr:RecName: Full=Nitrogenase molybdenum-iron protein alpha chain; AltName: Full=Dinitrogenase; AltName: Full=Nitrogenase component I [Frankia alni]CAA40327.1 dinitrogenase reductase [Frankia sp.]